MRDAGVGTYRGFPIGVVLEYRAYDEARPQQTTDVTAYDSSASPPIRVPQGCPGDSIEGRTFLESVEERSQPQVSNPYTVGITQRFEQ